LYIERVLIQEDCRDLLPDSLRFVRGVVDAEGLSLNVSRELVQDDRQLRTIRKHLEKKILDGLKALRNKDREKYNTFWHEFGPAMKEALLSGIGDTNKILDLLVCKSTKETSTTLEEYIGRMKDDQTTIYAMAAPTAELAGKSPVLEGFKAADIEVLLLDDRIDEVWLQQALEFNDKEIRSAASETPPKSDAKSDQDETKENETYKELLLKLRVALQDEVKDVRISQRLTSSPACLVTDKGDLTPQMEMLMRQSGQAVPKIKRILEINPEHAILQRLSARAEGDVINYARGLYGQALLAGGGEIVDPVAMAEVMTALMGEALA
jgi:molecular chaperone HtpG